MSYLKAIIEAKGLTRHQVAEMSGLAYSSIVVILNNDSFEYSHKTTQLKLADALGFTVSEIINGGENMRKKLIETKVRQAVETLTMALNTYSDKPMYLSLAIFTKDKTVRTETDPEGTPDYYTVRSYVADTEQEHTAGDFFIPKETVIDESARVYYGEDGIRQVIPFER